MRFERTISFAAAMLALAVSVQAASDAIYDEKADAHQQIAAAIAAASKTRRNIVLDFGANWCEDCHVLEAQMQRPDLAALVVTRYVVVNIDVGRLDKNLDLASSTAFRSTKAFRPWPCSTRTASCFTRRSKASSRTRAT